ncbi:hypothetical protein IF1G_08630 [Cordyceps javanica]|uniref:Uncharacterized protein n=1 Tax=Cordyceps javanica TaxID=43265 RepID=A0A545UTB8_9HYPO|nr:hypothetical protein IF1G_08630 [Cordyceps javanica]
MFSELEMRKNVTVYLLPLFNLVPSTWVHNSANLCSSQCTFESATHSQKTRKSEHK